MHMDMRVIEVTDSKSEVRQFREQYCIISLQGMRGSPLVQNIFLEGSVESSNSYSCCLALDRGKS